MKVISSQGFYFSGKIRDLLKELHAMSKKYKTLHELLSKNTQ
ncbi:hypothetical protein SOV_21930 [Sporomusa ovata DSM 2662]|uniref:Uncharacterized protein n=1 Tax=Sporomusa ovata TaxID=2378 RepID=A0A0U1L3I1_9FIRM|nr:hypothetical protein [Sporomusa ovata]EQB25510.1 hypothetical protein SOV_4c01720 [Sporomusa ovata DSM 2662]CQR74075.1 hypothetical protein SpAn4DRAFT_0537 [Sporomusa ovata]